MTCGHPAEALPSRAPGRLAAPSPVALGLTSSRPQEVALLERALQLELSLWHLYCLLGDPQASSHDPPPAVRRAADHRQHIIALRTRLAILGCLPPRRSTLGGLHRLRLHMWQQVGRRRPLLAAIAATERSLGQLYAHGDDNVLGRPSRLLWRRLRDDLHRSRSGQPIPSAAVGRMGTDARRYRSNSKHWAYARL